MEGATMSTSDVHRTAKAWNTGNPFRDSRPCVAGKTAQALVLPLLILWVVGEVLCLLDESSQETGSTEEVIAYAVKTITQCI